MPDSSQLLSHFYLMLDGAVALDELMRDVMEITVENSLHLPDVAMIVLNDPHLKWIDASSPSAPSTVSIGSPLASTRARFRTSPTAIW